MTVTEVTLKALRSRSGFVVGQLNYEAAKSKNKEYYYREI